MPDISVFQQQEAGQFPKIHKFLSQINSLHIHIHLQLQHSHGSSSILQLKITFHIPHALDQYLSLSEIAMPFERL